MIEDALGNEELPLAELVDALVPRWSPAGAPCLVGDIERAIEALVEDGTLSLEPRGGLEHVRMRG